MRIRPQLFLGAVAVLALSVALVLWHSKRTVNGPSEPVASVEDLPGRPVEPASATVPAGSPGNDVPIVFYGRLEDQAAEPVAQAEIVGTTVFPNGVATQFSTKSDAEGIFKFEAGSGESLEFTARKVGYGPASTNNAVFHGNSKPGQERPHPDPNQPVIFKMWRLQGAEPLATINGRCQFRAGDGPVYFDFDTQTFVPTNGDIKITVKRPPGVIAPGEGPEWSVELEGVDGGLMEITAGEWSSTYWAPVDGYQPKQVLLVSTNAPNRWSRTANGSFFVKTRQGGVYTKMALRVDLNLNPNDPLDLALWGISNTNGSCNWEGDPGTLK